MEVSMTLTNTSYWDGVAVNMSCSPIPILYIMKLSVAVFFDALLTMGDFRNVEEVISCTASSSPVLMWLFMSYQSNFLSKFKLIPLTRKESFSWLASLYVGGS